jgi:hypothetical protein
MNPFVNPNKRSITLPDGCKDLIDVLKHEGGNKIIARRFICLLLLQADQERATELIIDVESPDGWVCLQYKIKGKWYDLDPFPSHIRPDVIAELVRMSNFPMGQIPGTGVLDECIGDVRLRWSVAMANLEAECILTRIED